MKWFHSIVHIYALCTLHLAQWTTLIIIFIIFIMRGQLRWALCLSGNSTLCFAVVIVIAAIVFILYKPSPSHTFHTRHAVQSAIADLLV